MTLLKAICQWRRLPLWLEILLALIIKIMILTLLWAAFFSKPQARHMKLPTEKLEQHLLSNTDFNIVANGRNDQTRDATNLKDSHDAH